MFKSILVPLDASPSAEAALEYACLLASAAKGKIHLGHIIYLPPAAPAPTGLVGPPLDPTGMTPSTQDLEYLEQHREEQEKRAGEIFDAARRICGQWSVGCDANCVTGQGADEIVRWAADVDMVAMGKLDDDAPASERALGRLTEAVMRGAPGPVLVAEAPFLRPDEVVSLYDGSDRAAHALHLGVEAAQQTGLPLSVLIAAAGETDGDALRARVEQYLNDYGMGAVTVRPAAFGATDEQLVEALRPHPRALLVMGSFGELRILEWLTGSTTRTLLKALPNAVILVRR